MSASERRRPRERSKGRKYRRRDWILVIIGIILLGLKPEAQMATFYSRRPSGRRDLGRDWKEGGDGISGDARRKRLTAPWIHNK